MLRPIHGHGRRPRHEASGCKPRSAPRRLHVSCYLVRCTLSCMLHVILYAARCHVCCMLSCMLHGMLYVASYVVCCMLCLRCMFRCTLHAGCACGTGRAAHGALFRPVASVPPVAYVSVHESSSHVCRQTPPLVRAAGPGAETSPTTTNECRAGLSGHEADRTSRGGADTACGATIAGSCGSRDCFHPQRLRGRGFRWATDTLSGSGAIGQYDGVSTVSTHSPT